MYKMTIEDLSRIQRWQAWERAKGEMKSMLQTFFSEANSTENQYEDLKGAMDEFIKNVEDNALQE